MIDKAREYKLILEEISSKKNCFADDETLASYFTTSFARQDPQ
jgi:hypothetical protein